ncbi:hypothetical protein K435DRAFT_880099 [Dendrothele bispora CBS 962.96]|uniref:Uncharacterized protein n=1 Tax=Dendrothele bispora (strain CBS 962.96) TaxID=1314807 RepID=A0A4S8KJZ8_DENBC|nr:hypothetical protein K435DRAFT_880099 [Dendrothele bispora CBS 962.96]
MPVYCTLPTKNYTIREFIAKAKSYDVAGAEDNNPNAGDAFYNFLLTGEALGEHHQANINVIPNLLPPNAGITTFRDYDSFIGIDEDLLVQGPLSIYPNPNPQYTLSSSVHIQIPFDEGRAVHLHRIPNFEIGYWGPRYQVHIFFPNLENSERHDVQLKAAHKKQWYDQVLRPTIGRLTPEALSDWPPNWSSELFRTKNKKGAYTYSTKLVADFNVPELAPLFRHYIYLNEVEWAENFFFVHTIRGVKHATHHSVNEAAAKHALDEFMKLAQVDMLSGLWWVDVALEFHSSDEQCLQWSTAGHFRVVRTLLEISDQNAERITTLGSSKYSKDLSSHLTQVSGCRIEPGSRAAGPYKAAYLQMYTTDKSITYAPEGRFHAKTLLMVEAMGRVQPPTHLDEVQNVYTASCDDVASNAHVEMRVPLKHGTKVMLHFRRTEIRSSLFAFSPAEWWGHRAYRVLAIKEVLRHQACGRSALRTAPEALLLTATCVWLANALHARPEDSPASRSLMRAALPVTEVDEDIDTHTLLFEPSRTPRGEDDDDPNEYLVPYVPNGMIFLRCVKMGVDVPRMRVNGPLLNGTSFEYWFGKTLDEVRLLMLSLVKLFSVPAM